jgi:hypothetical protein
MKESLNITGLQMVKYRYKNKIDMKEILEFQDVRCDL